MEQEHSERAHYVTNQVKLWAANDGEHINELRAAANEGAEALAKTATKIIREGAPYSAPWQVRQELAPNDMARIRWADVRNELVEEVS